MFESLIRGTKYRFQNNNLKIGLNYTIKNVCDDMM
jgi:hypothetical protein